MKQIARPKVKGPAPSQPVPNARIASVRPNRMWHNYGGTPAPKQLKNLVRQSTGQRVETREA